MQIDEYLTKLKLNSEITIKETTSFTFAYLNNFIDKSFWEKYILPQLLINFNTIYFPDLIFEVTNNTFQHYDYLLGTGNILIIHKNKIYNCMIPLTSKRSISDSLIDPSNLNGSRDGLIEDLGTNLSLIKKRLKTSNLQFDNFIIGNNTMTKVSLCHLNRPELQKVISKISSQLKTNNANDITNIQDLNNIFTNHKLFPKLMYTSNPETIVNSLLKGKICILIDNSPLCAIIGNSLFEFTEIQNEVNQLPYITIFNRFLILIFLFLSIFSLGLYVCLTSFHTEVLSTIFISNFQLSELGTTMPLFLEIVFILLLFEFYRHISARSPLSFVQNIIVIFGGIFIGQNAIDASLIGSLTLIMTALAFVSSFAVTNNQEIITSLSIFRLFILLFSFAAGLLGFTIATICLTCYLAHERFLDKTYLFPFIPFDRKKIKNWFIPKKR